MTTAPDSQRARTAYRVYLASSAATFFALHMVYTMAAVYYVRVVGMSPLQLVLVGTALEAGYFAFEVPTGVVADAYSRKWSVIAGTALLGVGFIAQGLAPLFSAIVVAEFGKGIAHTFISGASEAWIADEIGEEAARRAYLRGAQFSTLGGLAGTLAGAGLATVQLDLPIVTGGGLMLVLAAVLALFMPEHGFRPAPREQRGSWAHMADIARQGWRVVRGRPVLTGLVAVTFVEGAFSEGLDRLWEAHLLANFSLPALGSVDPVFGSASSTPPEWCWPRRAPRWRAAALTPPARGRAQPSCCCSQRPWLRAWPCSAWHGRSPWRWRPDWWPRSAGQ